MYRLPEIQVSAPIPKAIDFGPSTSQLSGPKFERKKQGTLGETLSREAGVSSSFFGPNASRPVIRGLGGDRIRILQNGVGNLDASAVSPDHAVSLDPFLIDRVEIIRGPSALIFGSNAVGGAVNVMSGRIPTILGERASFRFAARGSSVDQGRWIGGVAQSRVDRFAFRLDGVTRASEPYLIPKNGWVPNSGNRTYDVSTGGSYVFDQGYVGTSLSAFHSQYGTVAEPDTSIDQGRQRLDLAGAYRFRESVTWESIQFKAAASQYQHQEFTGSQLGTTFQTQGVESRVELRQKPQAALRGVTGIQYQWFNFKADGTEAFLPTTINRSVAVFSFQEIDWGTFTPSLGMRLDRSSVDDLGFTSPSVSGGVVQHFSSIWSLGLHGSYAERSPNFQELFANGAHVATGIFEIGDRTLDKERTRALELTLRAKSLNGDREGRVGVFAQDFSSFIALTPTGSVDPVSTLSVYRYQAVAAQLGGLEVEYRAPLAGKWQIEGKVDWVRGLNVTQSSNLPRMPPFRETLILSYPAEHWFGEIELARSEAQGLTAPGETPTEAYLWTNLTLEIPGRTPWADLRFTFRILNLFDVEARNAVSFVKDRAPLPGRNFVFGIQASL